MPNYSVAEAKDSFSQLIDKACAGEEVVITRRGEVIAEIRPKASVAPKDDDDIYERLRKFRDSQPMATIGAAELIREMRDEGY